MYHGIRKTITRLKSAKMDV